MKQALTIIAIIGLIIASMGLANAEDVILDTTIDSATVALTKNGNEYVRFIVKEKRTLSGVEYDRSLPAMAFGDLVTQAKQMAAGDQLKAVATLSSFNGRESYTILGFITE